MVKNNHRITSGMTAESLNIPKTVALWILKEGFGKRRLCARFVSHSLTPEQREDRVTSCHDIIAMADANKQGVVHKEFVPEGKTVNAEFYKGAMDRHPKRIQWVRPAVFCSRDFFLLHNNAPVHKAANVCQFLIQKNVTTFLIPVLYRFISTRLFSVP